MQVMRLIAFRLKQQVTDGIAVRIFCILVCIARLRTVDVHPFFLRAQSEDPFEVMHCFVDVCLDDVLGRTIADKMVQIIKRPLFFLEVHLPTSAKRAISVRCDIFFDEEAACSIALVGDGNGGGHACDAGANDNDVVFAIPFLVRRACAAVVPRSASHNAERGCASEGDTRAFNKVATRGCHSVGHFVVSHDSSLSMSGPTKFVLSKKPFSDFSRGV